MLMVGSTTAAAAASAVGDGAAVGTAVGATVGTAVGGGFVAVGAGVCTGWQAARTRDTTTSKVTRESDFKDILGFDRDNIQVSLEHFEFVQPVLYNLTHADLNWIYIIRIRMPPIFSKKKPARRFLTGLFSYLAHPGLSWRIPLRMLSARTHQ
jgi:hypothetical protein